MKVILLDTRANFRDDVRTRLMIDDERTVELCTDLASSGSLDTAIAHYKPDAVIVADNVFGERSSWGNLGLPVVGYITKKGGMDVFTAEGIPTYGEILSSTHLLNLLESVLPEVKKEMPKVFTPNSAGTSLQPNSTTDPSQKPTVYAQQAEMPVMSTPRYDGTKPSSYEVPNYYAAPSQPAGASQYGNTSPLDTPSNPQYTPFNPYGAPMNPQHPPAKPNNTSASQQYPSVAPVVPPVNPQPNTGYYPNSPTTIKDDTQSAKKYSDVNRDLRQASEAEMQFSYDSAPPIKNTKTVAVYSAKGGVGKTTVATELAVCLSMISQGRGRLRVCIVDYNIDFGDVQTTLGFDEKGPNLRHWAGEIRRNLKAGDAPESINFTKEEIENRLQRLNDTSLYALVAPVKHEDSYDIESEELNVILRNIVQNGEFDFVICDTGNNTRDSTVIALETSDVVLLIATQDVSAINCDQLFLNTMKKIGFDTSKIRLIINNIMPVKYTQVTVQEIEEFFPYPCIARFKREADVTKANNCSDPVVKNPNHPFSQEMRNVCAYLTGQQVEAPKGKQKTRRSLFGKKKR